MDPWGDAAWPDPPLLSCLAQGEAAARDAERALQREKQRQDADLVSLQDSLLLTVQETVSSARQQVSARGEEARGRRADAVEAAQAESARSPGRGQAVKG